MNVVAPTGVQQPSASDETTGLSVFVESTATASSKLGSTHLQAMGFLEELQRTKADTLPYFDLADEDLEKTYAPGKWTVRYILNHLADSETVLFYRIRRVISEPNQVIWVYDQDAWARRLDYSTVPLSLAKSLYSSSRDGVMHYATRHYDSSADITFVHSQTGLRTLKDEFDKVVWHNQRHLDDVRKALR